MAFFTESVNSVVSRPVAIILAIEIDGHNGFATVGAPMPLPQEIDGNKLAGFLVSLCLSCGKGFDNVIATDGTDLANEFGDRDGLPSSNGRNSVNGAIEICYETILKMIFLTAKVTMMV